MMDSLRGVTFLAIFLLAICEIVSGNLISQGYRDYRNDRENYGTRGQQDNQQNTPYKYNSDGTAQRQNTYQIGRYNRQHNPYGPIAVKPNYWTTTTTTPMPRLRQTGRIGWCIEDVTYDMLNGTRIYSRRTNRVVGSVEVCCDGYSMRTISKKQHCLPECENGCPNGFCVEPDRCECFPDHVKNLAGQCVHTCPIGCLNGICNYDGTCTCYTGYILHHTNKFCVPMCRFECDANLRLNCTRPSYCGCMDGYEPDNHQICRPVCKKDCGYGRGVCTGPDLCTCFEGYILKNSVCQSHCDEDCKHGVCVAPNRCQCEDGYTVVDNTCQPRCENCNYGDCIAPETCRCNVGYANKTPGTCEPHCRYGCKHGYCASPNVCKCYPGYEKTYTGSCQKRTT